MKKLLFNVISVLILSICVSSCSKKDDVTPATQDDVVGTWTISTVVDGIDDPSGLDADQQEKFGEFKTKLKSLFQQGDKYTFANGSSCSVSRGESTAERPTRYEVSGEFLIFDGFIKFKTNLSDNKLTLTAGKEEIREIARTELKNPDYGIDESDIGTIEKFLSGKLELSLTKEN